MKHARVAFPSFAWLLVLVLSLGACAPAALAPPPAAPTSTAPAPASPTAAPPTETPRPLGPDEVEIRLVDVTSQALAGNLLGDPATRRIAVLLPPGYGASDRRYPVVFALHIYVGDSLTLAWPMKQVMEKAHKADSAKDVIVVLPNGDNKGFGTWYLNNPATGDWETHIARELVKYVDDHFRTIPQGASRGIMGCSNGGSGAMHLALKYPDAFGAVASLSGVYDWANHPWLHFLIDYFATRPPKDFDEIRKRSGLDWRPAAMMVLAVETLPDPNKPPLYVDLPFKAVNGQGQLDAEAWSKASALDPLHDAQRYAKEDPRLRGILVTAGSLEQAVLAAAQDFDKVLTDLGIAHDFVETDGCGCDCDGFDFAPAFQYITAHLAFK